MNDFKKIVFALYLLTPLASHAAEPRTIKPSVIIIGAIIQIKENKTQSPLPQKLLPEDDQETLRLQFAQEQGREKWDAEREERIGRRLDKW
jgi:hypothetical protein